MKEGLGFCLSLFLVLTKPSPLLPFPPFSTPKAQLWGMCNVTGAPSPGFEKNPHPSDSAGQLPRDSAQRRPTGRYPWPRAQRRREAGSDLSLPAETPETLNKTFSHCNFHVHDTHSAHFIEVVFSNEEICETFFYLFLF